MRRRIFPNLVGDFASLEERQARLERVLQVVGFTPDMPYTLTVNDGTLNRVLIGKINGDYGIKIVDNANNEVILTNGTIVATAIKTGTLDCSLLTVENLNAESITTGTLSATFISGGVFDCSLMTVQNLNAGSITVGQFVNINDRLPGTSIHGDKIQTGTLEANRIVANSINANQIAAHSVSGDELSFNTITADHMNINTLSAISANLGTITAGTIDAAIITVRNLNASNITVGNLSSSGVNVKADLVNYGNFNFNNVTVLGTLTANHIVGGDLNIGGTGYAEINVYSSGNNLAAKIDSGGILIKNGYVFKYENGLELADLGGGNLEFRGYGGGFEFKNVDRFIVSADDMYVYCDLWVTDDIHSSRSCYIDHDLWVSGSKNFRIKHPLKKGNWLIYTSVESNGVYLDIHGSVEIKNEQAEIRFPDYHISVICDKPNIQLTKEGWLGDCCVTDVKMEGFTIITKGAKDGDKVMWSARSTRKGYENKEIEPKIID